MKKINGSEIVPGMTVIGSAGGMSLVISDSHYGSGEGTEYLHTEHGLLLLDLSKDYWVCEPGESTVPLPVGWEGTD
jgi:hypothetical protein